MASDAELYSLRNNSELLNSLTVAIGLTIGAITVEDPMTDNHAARAEWATRALGDMEAEARRVIWVFLSLHKDQSVEEITKIAATAMQDTVSKYVSIVTTQKAA